MTINPTALTNLILRLLFVAVAGWLVWALWSQLQAAPLRAEASKTTVRLAAGESTLVGRRELAAPAADTVHLRVARDATGEWSIANVSPSKGLDLTAPDGTERSARSVVLAKGSTFSIDDHTWTVNALSPELVLKQHDVAVWQFNQARLLAARLHESDEGASFAQVRACPDEQASQKLLRFWNSVVPAVLKKSMPILLAGNVACSNRIPVAGLDASAVSLRLTQTGLLLTATPAAARRVCTMQSTSTATDALPCPVGSTLFERATPLAQVQSMVVGRSRYALSVNADTLTLLPTARVGWVSSVSTTPLNPALAQSIAAEDRWGISGWSLQILLISACIALLVVSIAAWQAYSRLRLTSVCALLLSASVACLGAAFAAALYIRSYGPAVSVIGATVALLWVATMPIKNRWMWLIICTVACLWLAGLHTQLALALQAPDNGAWLMFKKTIAFGAITLIGAVVACWLSIAVSQANRSFVPDSITAEVCILLLAIVGATGLFVQAVWGREQGVFGIQPVELAKLALVVVGAHALSVRLDWQDRAERLGTWFSITLWLRFAMPVCLFLSLMGVALLLTHDYSPMLLISGWLVGALLSWAVAARRIMPGLMAFLLIGATLGVIWWLHGSSGQDWVLAKGFYGERFAVWAVPELHPHNGSQYLSAVKLASTGGLSGSSNAYGWAVPEVEFDMTPAFFSGRYGAFGVTALMAGQWLLVGLLTMLGWGALNQSTRGNAQSRWAGHMVFFSSWGFAALFACHLVISWGANFGFMPVMGQPMPLLSAAGSWIALLLAPLLVGLTITSCVNSRS